MNINKKLYPTVLVLAALILLLALVSSATALATGQSTSPTITEIQITKNFSDCPAIYDNKIVWQDKRNGNWNIYMYDLSTKKETQITTNKFDQINPDIYGNKVVWQDERKGNWDIYMYDLSTKKETQITTNASNSERPDIYGDKIVWSDDRNGKGYDHDGGLSGNPDIYMYDLSTKKETRITTSRAAANPKISGDKIVWCDLRNGNWDIYMYDLSTKKETQITSSKSMQVDPEIYGNKIVWVDNEDGLNIHMYDLSTSKETQITHSGKVWEGTPIYGNKIVWQDKRNGFGDIYMYDLSTNQETQITTSKSASSPAIYDNKIVWADWKNSGYNEIYMATIGSSLPVADFSASPTSGKTPLNVKFTDTSTGSPTSWFWNFGDGSKSYLQNPVHKYSKAGIYTVNLTVKNAAGRNTVTKTDYIKVITKPVAAFSASPTSGKAPLTVAFTDKSTGTPTKWKWSFGDGTISREKNPEHQYSQEGNYKITLTVSNAAGGNTITKTNYIKVTTNTRPGIYSENK